VHWAKRTRAATEREPVASAGQGITSADTAVTSPQPIPQREAMVQLPLTSAGTDVPSSKPDKEMGEVRQEEGRLGADSVVATLSTTIPESASPARASADEPVCTEIVPANEATDDRAPATEVAGEGTTLPQ
jgi:hypothetical protein